MYRNKKGEWVVYNNSFSFSTADRRQVGKRLAKYGVEPAEVEELFKGEAKNGEGVIDIPIGLERLYEWSMGTGLRHTIHLSEFARLPGG